jgi:hypothetical protein
VERDHVRVLDPIVPVDLLDDQLGVGEDADPTGALPERVTQGVEQSLVLCDVVRGPAQIAIQAGLLDPIRTADLDAKSCLAGITAAGSVDMYEEWLVRRTARHGSGDTVVGGGGT